MSFDLQTILIFVLAALLYGLFLPARARSWALLVGSVVAIYWLQPLLPIRFSGYILPTLTLVLTMSMWRFIAIARTNTHANDTAEPGRNEQTITREDWLTLLVVVGLIVGMAFFRFVPLAYRLTAVRPPNPLHVLGGLIIAAALVALLIPFARKAKPERLMGICMGVIVVLFVVLKSGWLATAVAGGWRSLTNQDISLASPADLAWLGFSYVAFRLIHTLRDQQNGILPALSLRQYLSYVIFAPAYIAGPIDRAERFLEDLQQIETVRRIITAPRIYESSYRIFSGMFKKFVIADSLALGMALNATNATQITNSFGAWLLLYGYAFRLYFDFSGYTDIAIGLGILFGIRLPENFKRPYRQTNITAFWQSWHITLSDWARFYVFTPLSRTLLRRKPRPSSTIIILTAQLATMITIGLWHGFTLNYLIWGVWHGLALFAHKQWSDRTRKWYRGLNNNPRQKQAWSLFGWLGTFHYVVLGWVWFVLPTPQLALQLFGKLFGWGG